MIEQTKQIHAKVIVRSDQINTMQFCGQCIDVWKSISLVSSVGGQPKKKMADNCVRVRMLTQSKSIREVQCAHLHSIFIFTMIQESTIDDYMNRQNKTEKKNQNFEVKFIHYYFAVDRVRLLWETNKSITAANIFGVIGHTGNNVTTGTFPHYYRISGHHRDRRRPQLIIAYRNTNAKQN